MTQAKIKQSFFPKENPKSDFNESYSMSQPTMTWAELETFYRKIAEDFMRESAEYKQKASKIDPSKPADARLKTNYAKMATKLIIQSKNFHELADRAKDKAWQDEASEKLAELQRDAERGVTAET